MPPESALEQRSAGLTALLDALPLNRRHWRVFGVCAAGFFFDSMDLQIMSLVAPTLMRRWDMSPQLLGLVTSAAMLGTFVGAAGLGTLADRLGRRTGFQFAVAVFAVSSALCALARSPGELIGLRFCAGLGLGGLIPITTTLMSEYMPARTRGRMVALWAVSFPVGGLAATGLVSVVLPHLGWQPVFAIGAVPVLLVFAVRGLVPETPRFLLARGRIADAERSVRWIALADADAVLSFDAPATAVRPARQRVRLATLFTRSHRRSTVVAWLMTFGWNFGYFGMVLWLPTLLMLSGLSLSEVFWYTLGFQLCAICGRGALLLVVDRLGRKPVIVIAGLAAAALMLLLGRSEALPWLFLVGYLVSFCEDGGMSGVVPYTPELYPTSVRGSGVGWAIAVGRIAGLIAPTLVGALVAASDRYAIFVVFAACYAGASLVVAILGVETHGRLPSEK